MLGWFKDNTARIMRNEQKPDAEFFSGAIAKSQFTPDIATLSRREFQLIFVYGTQMRGHPEHELVIAHGAYLATAYTGQRYTLWKKRLGEASFPIALTGVGWSRPDWARPTPSFVQGELYAIPTAQLIELDKHYQNTLEFERKRMLMTIPYRKLYRVCSPDTQAAIDKYFGIESAVVTTQTSVEIVKAWMYIGKPDHWDDQLGHFFNPVDRYHPRLAWLGDYFAFTQREYGK